jgi:hypothetical protein
MEIIARLKELNYTKSIKLEIKLTLKNRNTNLKTHLLSFIYLYWIFYQTDDGKRYRMAELMHKIYCTVTLIKLKKDHIKDSLKN